MEKTRISSIALYLSRRKWVVGFATLLAFVTTVPYLLGFAFQGDSWYFTGFVFGVQDGNSYIAKMLMGSTGNWLFRSPYTAYSQRGVLVFMPYLLIGKLASGPALHDQLVALFHWFRILSIYLCALATYDFVSYFIRGEYLRRLALLIIMVGGGLGWVFVIFGFQSIKEWIPLEFISPETFGFLAIYGLPHIAMARALLYWGCLWMFKSHTQRESMGFNRGFLLGILWLVMGLFHPLDMVVGLLLAGMYFLFLLLRHGEDQFRKNYIMQAIGIATPLLLFILYNYLAVIIDPFVCAWYGQNRITSPPLIHYAIAYGFLIPFLLVFVFRSKERSQPAHLLLLLWALSTPILAYAPTNLQRRLVDGVWAAWVILAYLGIDQLSIKWKKIIYPAFGLLLGSSVMLLGWGIKAVSQPDFPLYRYRDEVLSFRVVAEQSNYGDVVLCSFDTGNALPAWAPVRVVIGHGPESPNLPELSNAVRSFFSAEVTDQWRKDFIHSMHVDFVFWGPFERRLGTYDPRQSSFLQPISKIGDYWVFRIKEDRY